MSVSKDVRILPALSGSLSLLLRRYHTVHCSSGEYLKFCISNTYLKYSNVLCIVYFKHILIGVSSTVPLAPICVCLLVRNDKRKKVSLSTSSLCAPWSLGTRLVSLQQLSPSPHLPPDTHELGLCWAKVLEYWSYSSRNFFSHSTARRIKYNIHRESKKLCHYTLVYNFDKCWPIFEILSLLYSPRNLQPNPCHITHHTLDVSLHYLAKLIN